MQRGKGRNNRLVSMVTDTHTTSKKYRLCVITSAPFYNANEIFMGENCERTQNRGRKKKEGKKAREEKRKMTGTVTRTTERMRMIAMMMMMRRRRGLLHMRAM